jgi:hypothetical protein
MHEPPEQLDEIRVQLALEPFNAELHQALGKALLKGSLKGSGVLSQSPLLYDSRPF